MCFQATRLSDFLLPLGRCSLEALFERLNIPYGSMPGGFGSVGNGSANNHKNLRDICRASGVLGHF